MYTLIYKQRHEHPNRKNTPARNFEHIDYIGNRVHALINEKSGNGLFGEIGRQFSDNFDVEKIQHYVTKLSREGTTIFRGMISFTEQNKQRLMLDTAQDWQDYVREMASIIARKNRIDIRNFEYVASVHLKENQPHVHITFWDKHKDVQRQEVEPELINDLRKEIIKKTFSVQFGILAKEKDLTFDKISEIADYQLKKYTVHDKEIDFSDGLYSLFEQLYDGLPKSGSLKFQLLPPEYKQKLLDFCGQLMNEYPELGKQYDRYTAIKQIQAESFNGYKSNYAKYQVATIVGKAKDEVSRKICNRVLKRLKELKKEERANLRAEKAETWAEKQEQFRQKQLRQAIFSLTFSIFHLLDHASGAAERQSDRIGITGKRGSDLSENERLEIAHELEDKGEAR